MEPIITSKGKLTQLRYEIQQRVHDAKIYPIQAPNGSTIIIYGHETGICVVWRGGRPLRKSKVPANEPPKPPKVNGTSDAIMIIDSDDDEPAKTAQPLPEAEFEDDEEELDPDHPYPSVVQRLQLSLSTEVLHIAVPNLPTVSSLRQADMIPPIFNNRMIFTVACVDYSVRVITLPLNPPPNSLKSQPLSPKSQYGEEVVKIPTHIGHQSIPRGVTMTWTSKKDPTFKDESADEMDVDAHEETAMTPGRRRHKKQSRSHSRPRGEVEGYDLLVASHSAELGGLLKLWRFSLTDAAVVAENPFMAYRVLTLQKPASQVAFNTAQFPKRRHSQLLITDSTGVARIYDPFAMPSRKRRSNLSEPGAFVALFRSTFGSLKTRSPGPPVLAARKPIIDAAWTSDGHYILALLADGEWGIWDIDRSGPSPPADPSAFSLRGFVGSSDKEASSGGPSSPKSRSGRSSLAPMTPNTRRRKEETLFHGSSSSTIPTRGGLSVASLPSSNGATPEDSVLIWYGQEISRIADLGKFWSRTAASSNGNSLPGPGLSQIHDVTLFGEAITSISQFDITARGVRMATPRDILVSAENRLIITTSTTRPLGRDLNAVFTREQAEEEEARKTDQVLLSRGELDIGGMDRLLENMEGSGNASKSFVLGNPRKVLFASSTT